MMVSKLLLFFIIIMSEYRFGVLSLCSDQKTCSDCIRVTPLCQWCAMDGYKGNRCLPINETFAGCDAMYIENPQSEQAATLNADYRSEGNGAITQIRPQRYSIKLRPGQSVDFEINFKGAENYPADVYFLVDTSSSMEKVQEAIIKSSVDIYKKMQTKTKDVYIGLGSFVDKNTLPYVAKIDESSPISSYRHHLNLTESYTEFQTAVQKMKLSTSIQKLRGGLDALAQAITCVDEIGWRQDSRKIIIYISDALFHVAGDGKWADITQPYDGKCYTKNGVYTKELEMDYPSISMIRKLAAENDMTIVFVAESNIKDNFKQLTRSIAGSKHNVFTIFSEGGALTAEFDSSIDINLSNIYEEIIRTIKLKEHMDAIDRKYISIGYKPDCTSKSLKENPSIKNMCTVSKGEEKSIVGTIKLTEYFEKDRTTVDVAIESIKERLTLDIEVIDCNCATKPERDSKYCTEKGTKICGLCECHPDRVGTYCECVKNNITRFEPDCKAPGSDLSCSGRGFCSCGICEKCLPGFNGKYCHCNDSSCPHSCYGRGVCDCGKCKECTGPWTGDACDCSTNSCPEINGKECNGRGECICAKCKCDPINASWDARITQNHESCKIDKCPDCHAKQCQLLTPCAICQYNNINNNKLEYCASCHPSIIIHNHTEDKDLITCKDVPLENDLGCFIEFQYRYNDDDYEIDLFIRNNKNCSQSYYIYGGIVLASIVAVGIVTLCVWKWLTDARDRREYERFLEQYRGDSTGPCENPIYEPATTTFSNPTFRKKSVDLY